MKVRAVPAVVACQARRGCSHSSPRNRPISSRRARISARGCSFSRRTSPIVCGAAARRTRGDASEARSCCGRGRSAPRVCSRSRRISSARSTREQSQEPSTPRIVGDHRERDRAPRASRRRIALDPNSSDYDCAGGSGNGPDYTGPVTVVGSDPHRLDNDRRRVRLRIFVTAAGRVRPATGPRRIGPATIPRGTANGPPRRGRSAGRA